MKKRLVSLILIVVLVFSIQISAYAASSGDWSEMPTITDIYELEKGKVYLEWDGNATLYYVYVDGKKEQTVNLKSTSINIKEGAHQIIIVPISLESKNVNTNVELGYGDFSGSIDLAALGIDPKNIYQGTASKTYKLNYTVNPFLNAVPEVLGATTDFEDRVCLSFSDKYNSDSYKVAIKSGKDINYVEFNTEEKETAALVSKSNTTVTIILDQKYLKLHGCMIPELDQKYGFSVKLQKWPVNQVDGSKEKAAVLESKDSKAYEYTPYAAWKLAPEITYASQTADGQITLQWTHEDSGLGCQYKVLSLDKVLGIKKGEQVLGTTSDKEYVVKDLMNGKHSFAIVPIYAREEGGASGEITIEVKNNWVIAPALTCEAGNNKQVKLKWTSPEQIESYHVTVYVGSGSLLRFVNLDYKKFTEFDVPAKSGSMDYTFRYDQPVETEDGVKLKFEIYGVRHATNGAEQKSSTSAQTVILK